MSHNIFQAKTTFQRRPLEDDRNNFCFEEKERTHIFSWGIILSPSGGGLAQDRVDLERSCSSIKINTICHVRFGLLVCQSSVQRPGPLLGSPHLHGVKHTTLTGWGFSSHIQRCKIKYRLFRWTAILNKVSTVLMNSNMIIKYGKIYVLAKTPCARINAHNHVLLAVRTNSSLSSSTMLCNILFQQHNNINNLAQYLIQSTINVIPV